MNQKMKKMHIMPISSFQPVVLFCGEKKVKISIIMQDLVHISGKKMCLGGGVFWPEI